MTPRRNITVPAPSTPRNGGEPAARAPDRRAPGVELWCPARDLISLVLAPHGGVESHEQKAIVSMMNVDVPILYINLDRSTDRRRFMESQGVEMIRVPAVDGALLGPEEMAIDDQRRDLTELELGCTLSHLKAVERALELKAPIALVLEDDADLGLSGMWKHSLRELAEKAPSDWEILQLYRFGFGSQVDDVTTVTFTPWAQRAGAVAYLIRRPGMEKLMAVTEGGKTLRGGADREGGGVSDLFLFTVCKTYTVSPRLIFPRNDTLPSLIHHDHTPAHIQTARVIQQSFLGPDACGPSAASEVICEDLCPLRKSRQGADPIRASAGDDEISRAT